MKLVYINALDAIINIENLDFIRKSNLQPDKYTIEIGFVNRAHEMKVYESEIQRTHAFNNILDKITKHLKG